VEARCADHITPLYPQRLALTWPTSGGRSVDIGRLRTKGHGVCVGIGRSSSDRIPMSCAEEVTGHPIWCGAVHYEGIFEPVRGTFCFLTDLIY
jgi:hypothetical protein